MYIKFPCNLHMAFCPRYNILSCSKKQNKCNKNCYSVTLRIVNILIQYSNTFPFSLCIFMTIKDRSHWNLCQGKTAIHLQMM